MNNNTKPETEPGADSGTEKLTSRIHPSVHYTPSRVVYPEDCDTELTVYEQTAFVRTFLMALGKPKYLFAERGVYFVPIYLVPTDPQAPKIQIGVYEYEKDRAVGPRRRPPAPAPALAAVAALARRLEFCRVYQYCGDRDSDRTTRRRLRM